MPAPLSSTFFIAGPTASGKSAVAAGLAQRIGGEVVNADAFQLYRELPITTAQPSPSELTAAPHHLYGALSAAESCDAQKYHQLVQPVIVSIIQRHRWPIVVGGSGLYIKALTHGLTPLPAADQALRDRLMTLTPEERRTQLLTLDPDAAENVPLSNDRYVSRALEVCLLTGQPQSKLRQNWQRDSPQFMGALIARDRADVISRISARTQQMLNGGMIDEVKQLPSHATNATKAIGVPQVRDYLAGQCSWGEMAESISIATRQYAKRQMTWFRREQGFQTICPAPDSTVTSITEQILLRFPCLLQPPPPFVPSSST